MPSFNAKTRDEMTGVATTGTAPGDRVPQADQNGFEYLGVHGYFTYRTRHDFAAICKPGYFDNIVQQNPRSYLGALVMFTCENGKPDYPEEWTGGFLRISRVRNRSIPGEAHVEKTLVAIVHRFPKATLVAHDGAPLEDAKAPAEA